MSAKFYLVLDGKTVPSTFGRNVLREHRTFHCEEAGMLVNNERVLWINPKVSNIHAHLHRKINRKAAIAAEITRKATGSMIWVQTGCYDHVDHVQLDNRPRWVGTDVALDWMIDNEFGDLDGECSYYVTLLTPKEADRADYGQRDHAMEAYENGHPHSIHAG